MSKDLLFILIFQFISILILLSLPGSKNRKTALILSIINFVLAFHTFFEFNPDKGFQYVSSFEWIPSLGIHFKIGMDGIGFLLFQLTNFLVPLIILSSFNREIKNPKAFYSLILLMQLSLNGVFTAMDGFLFYIFWELALLPIWFICLFWGGSDSKRITLKFFIYTLTGSLLMLAGLIYLYLQTPGEHSFDLHAFYDLQLTESQQSFVFWMFFIAFAVKIPIFPLHTWQPDTYTDSPTQGTMLLSGIMLKMGIYGLIRWILPVAPEGVQQWGSIAMILAVTGIVYASSIALAQKDFKRMIAYSSIAHVGLISAGIFSLTVEGLQGAMVQMLAHGVNVVGLFFISDMIFSRMNTRQMEELGGIAHSQKLFSIFFMIILLASIALPLTNGFVGEFLLLTGIYKYGAWTAVFAETTVILGAVYMLRSYKAIMLGEAMELQKQEKFTPLCGNEKMVLGIIIFVILLTGLFPKLLTDISGPSVNEILNQIK